MRETTTTTTTGQVIDARGVACPGPPLSLIGAIRQRQVGAVLEVWSTDQGSATDIPAWVADQDVQPQVLFDLILEVEAVDQGDPLVALA
jgi:TusA-related sulfurtransferase